MWLYQLLAMRFCFLYAENIGVLLGHPIEESFTTSRADAIGVESNNAHGVEVVCSL
jgi:hypothetical protein